MSDLEFDRDAVGINALADWKDAETLAWVGAFTGRIPVDAVALDLPKGETDGVAALRSALVDFKRVMGAVVLEYSDAYAVLGSGQEEMIKDNDFTESQNTDNFRELTRRMEGK